MAKISDKLTERVEQWLLGDRTLEQCHFQPDQYFRTKLCYEAYQRWMQNKQIRPTDLMRRLAAREYPILLAKAQDGDKVAQGIVKACNIIKDKPRTVTEISNDVTLLNWIIGRFNAPTEFIERAKVEDASDWLIREGMKMGDARAVTSGAKLKMELYDNFQEKNNAAENMPETDFTISGDVSLIKSDRVNYTDEEKAAMAKKYGISQKEVTEMIQTEDGTWQMPDEQPEAEPELDIIATENDY